MSEEEQTETHKQMTEIRSRMVGDIMTYVQSTETNEDEKMNDLLRGLISQGREGIAMLTQSGEEFGINEFDLVEGALERTKWKTEKGGMNPIRAL